MRQNAGRSPTDEPGGPLERAAIPAKALGKYGVSEKFFVDFSGYLPEGFVAAACPLVLLDAPSGHAAALAKIAVAKPSRWPRFASCPEALSAIVSPRRLRSFSAVPRFQTARLVLPRCDGGGRRTTPLRRPSAFRKAVKNLLGRPETPRQGFPRCGHLAFRPLPWPCTCPARQVLTAAADT